MAVGWRHRCIPGKQCQIYKRKSKISVMITRLLSDMLNNISKEKFCICFGCKILTQLYSTVDQTAPSMGHLRQLFHFILNFRQLTVDCIFDSRAYPLTSASSEGSRFQATGKFQTFATTHFLDLVQFNNAQPSMTIRDFFFFKSSLFGISAVCFKCRVVCYFHFLNKLLFAVFLLEKKFFFFSLHVCK